MTKEKSLSVEFKFKIAGLLLTLATIVVSVWKYTNEQTYQFEMEFKRKIWQKQLETYTSACKYSGLIANRPAIDFEKNVGEFGALYWGEMIMIEDTIVGKAMKEFYYAAHDYNSEDENSEFRLKYKADALAKACRESSRRTWLSEKLLE